jgi:hypothetical protein
MSRTGDQDWFNMLSWSHPGLVYILPCVYNWQTSVQVTQCGNNPIFCKADICLIILKPHILWLYFCGAYRGTYPV